MWKYTYICLLSLSKARHDKVVSVAGMSFLMYSSLLFIRSMTAFKGDSKVMKLFAKHIKVSKVLGGPGGDGRGP